MYIYIFLVACSFFFFRENTFRETFSGRKYVFYRSVSKVERTGKSDSPPTTANLAN